MSVFSTPEQLIDMREILSRYALLPFSQSRIPGALVESILAHVRGGVVLDTYDFVDVVDANTGCGWQVKSTKATTPVTWKRAKLANAPELIEASRRSSQGLQVLGEAIINFCNEHARASINKYDLKEIGYSRLILGDNQEARYFERVLCSQQFPDIFDPSEFEWNWSLQKKTLTKEQLPALHGISRRTGQKCWAWHGLGENQLHFSGESAWWPHEDSDHSFSFRLPSDNEKMSFSRFVELIQKSHV